MDGHSHILLYTHTHVHTHTHTHTHTHKVLMRIHKRKNTHPDRNMHNKHTLAQSQVEHKRTHKAKWSTPTLLPTVLTGDWLLVEIKYPVVWRGWGLLRIPACCNKMHGYCAASCAKKQTVTPCFLRSSFLKKIYFYEIKRKGMWGHCWFELSLTARITHFLTFSVFLCLSFKQRHYITIVLNLWIVSAALFNDI